MQKEYTELFKTKAGKKEIVSSLRSLTKNKGWSILMLYFEDLVERQENILHDINTPTTDKDLQLTRIRLYYIKELMKMPEILVKGILGVKDDDIPTGIYE